MKRNPAYRSSEKTLIKFTGSNMIWRSGDELPEKHPAKQLNASEIKFTLFLFDTERTPATILVILG